MSAAVLPRSWVKLNFLCDYIHPGDEALKSLGELNISGTAEL